MTALRVALASTLVGCRAGRQPPGGVPAPAAVDALFAGYAEPGAPGASVVVVRDGHAVLRRAYGLAVLETRTPATTASDYRLASLTKQFTATAVMLLVADRRLRYDDRVVDLLPGFPAYAREVRVRDLLNHTSGLWDYEDFVADTQAVQVRDRDVLALLARADRTYFPPGTRFRYSNSGYAVLALLVERASGIPFARFLHERVFAPLGMSSTVAYEAGVSEVPHRAYGYSRRGGAWVRTDQSPTSAVLGDGGVYSSVDDLVRWDRALERATLVSGEALRQAWTPPSLPAGARTSYGFGWFVDDDRGATRLSHHGETMGFTNAILRYPDRRLTVIVLTNRSGGEPWALAQRVAGRYLDGAARGPAPPFPFAADDSERGPAPD